MPRIKGRKPEDTRESVLAAAIWAFAELGFENATLATIAQRAGVTAATLPYHFKDKQGLWDAVIGEFYRGVVRFATSFSVDGAEAQGLDAALERVYGWAEENRNGIRVIIRNVIETGALDRQVRDVQMGPAFDLASRLTAQRFGVPLERARNAAVVVTHLMTRFVTNSPEDNRQALGVRTQAEARQRIIASIVTTARALLGLPASA